MNFIQTVVKPRKDRVLFGTFDDEIKLLQDFTDKLDLLDKAVYEIGYELNNRPSWVLIPIRGIKHILQTA